jgi:hypothetical protein
MLALTALVVLLGVTVLMVIAGNIIEDRVDDRIETVNKDFDATLNRFRADVMRDLDARIAAAGAAAGIPSVTPVPTPAPTPAPTVQGDGSTATPTPTPSPASTPTAEATPTESPHEELRP